LLALFADDAPFIARLIEATPEITATSIHDLPSLPAWHRGRVVLMGDAAHAVSPSSGQGASLALEDAIVLAKCLRDVTPVESALARYEALRRPRAERIVADGRRRGTYKALRSRAAVRLRDLVMPLALRVFANGQRLAWIHDYRVRWDEPVTGRAAGRADRLARDAVREGPVSRSGERAARRSVVLAGDAAAAPLATTAPRLAYARRRSHVCSGHGL